MNPIDTLIAYEESHATYTTQMVTTYEGTREDRIRRACGCALCDAARALFPAPEVVSAETSPAD